MFWKYSQRRIVGILDEAFDGIATAKANAEKNLRNARALFESLLDAALNGQLTIELIAPAGPPAPVGDRNNHIQYYDHLDITLNEHHYTFQVQAITVVLNTIDAIHPTTSPFSGTLRIGGVNVAAGDTESDLEGMAIQFLSHLPGNWSADVQSAPMDGHRIHVSIDTKGRRLPSGRRSRIREILSVSLSLEHDPWDTTHRPRCPT